MVVFQFGFQAKLDYHVATFGEAMIRAELRTWDVLNVEREFGVTNCESIVPLLQTKS